VTALESRVVIEQAKGIIAEHEHISVDGAFEVIRSYARSRNRRLSVVARELREGSLLPEQLAPAPETRNKSNQDS